MQIGKLWKLAVMACLMGLPAVAAMTVHVSPTGSDQGDGSEAKPLATLGAARDRVRAIQDGGETAEVLVHNGTYPLGQTLSFEVADSGRKGLVRWRAREKGKVTLTGGTLVKAGDFKAVGDGTVLERLHPSVRGKMLELDLKALAIKNAGPCPDYFKEDDDGLLKVVIDGLEAPISKWPKKGHARMVDVVEMGATKGGPVPRFHYDDPTPEKWDLGGGIWLSGWWRVEFARDTVKLVKVDGDNKEITLGATVFNGIGSKFHRPNKATGKTGSGKEPWFAVNVLEEAREPGEWAIDMRTKKLYLVPPADFTSRTIEISDQKGALIRVNGASNLSFENFILTTGLEDGVLLSNAVSVRVAGCEIRSVKSGVRAYEPFRVETISCDIHDIRDIGVQYDYYEDRKSVEVFRSPRSKSLMAGNDRIVNNHIWNAAVGITMGSTGYPVAGVVANNRVHDIRGMGMRYGGNDLVIEKNEFYNFLLTAGDGGAIYSAQRVTDRGNLVRHNFIHHAPGANAIYVDDGECGTTAVGNVIIGADVGLWVSGGRENVMVSNLVIGMHTAALHADDRGVSRGYGDPKTYDGSKMWGLQYASIDLKSGPWADRYPDMEEALSANRGFPVRNVMGHNIIIDAGTEFRRKYKEESFIECRWDPNFMEFSRADFANLETLDLKPAPGSAIGNHPVYKAIPFGSMGLVVDEFRTSLPPPDPGRLVAKRRFGQDDVSAQDMETSNKKK